jgi:hypothetical protein
VTEERVVDKAFNLLFAFDEAITSGGYKEHVTLANIKTYLVGGERHWVSSPPPPRCVRQLWSRSSRAKGCL